MHMRDLTAETRSGVPVTCQGMHFEKTEQEDGLLGHKCTSCIECSR